MKICLDLRTLGNGYHGIARYGMELARALLALGTHHRLCVLVRRGVKLERLLPSGTEVSCCIGKPYSLWEQCFVPPVVARIEPQLYHCTTYLFPLFVRSPTVVTIHDFLPLERPQDFSLSRRWLYRILLRRVTERAARIVAVSRYTACTIQRRFPFARSKLRVIPSGGDHVLRCSVSQDDQNLYRAINPKNLDYFLSIANPRPHKNILFSVRCFVRSEALRRREVVYILVGQQHPSVRAFVRSRHAEARVRFVGAVSEGLLRLLYAKAIALVSPSLGEGFCLPAVEAMQFGLPVIAARDGALPEVLGPVGVLLPPRDATAWQDALERIHEEQSMGAWDPGPVRERGREFSWAQAAKETMALYEEVAYYERKGSPGLRG